MITRLKVIVFITRREYPLKTGSTYKNILAFLAFLAFLQILLHKAIITSWPSRSYRSSFLGKKIFGGVLLIEIQKSGSAMSCAMSQLVYMPNFRAIGQSVWEKNGNTQTDRQTETQKDRNTDLNFIYRD